jgi:hypothetical protein
MSDKEIFGDERARRVSHLAANWGRPKSACVCGHTGDGPKSEHGGAIAAGHGRCLVAHCGCSQFTWQHFTTEFQTALDRLVAP